MIRHAKGALCPFVQLEMSGSQAKPVRRVGVDVKGGQCQLVAIKDIQQTTKESCMIHGETDL